jgi:hypothetical protein
MTEKSFETAPISPPRRLLQMLDGLWIAQALYVAARLGLADLLADGSRSLPELAATTQADASSLYRLLRALGSVDTFQEIHPAIFANTELSTCLRSDQPDSLYHVALVRGSEWNWRTWGELLYSVQLGRPSFDLFHGMPFQKYLTHDLGAGRMYHQAMLALSNVIGGAVATAYDFSSLRTLVEYAGENGMLLPLILARNPMQHGLLLFEHMDRAEHTKAWLARRGLGQRCEVVAGDVLTRLAASGADAILLTRMLRSHSDEENQRLLRACHQALAPAGKLLLVEQIVPPAPQKAALSLFADLELAVYTHEGRERTEAEYRASLEAARFSLVQVVPTTAPYSLLEAVPLL